MHRQQKEGYKVSKFIPARVGTPALEYDDSEKEPPYVTFLAAVETGIITDPAELARPMDRTLRSDLERATLPNCKRAGVIEEEIRDGLLAFDLVAAVIRRGSLEIYPASKRAIVDGRIERDGLILLGDSEGGLVKVAGIAVDNRRYWPFVERMRQEHRLVVDLGKVSLCLGDSLGWPLFEPKDIDRRTGAEKLVPYQRVFPLS